MKPITFALAIVFILLSSVAEYLVASAAPTSLSVTIVGADNNDPRWRAVDEAVEFWNQQLNGAEIAVRLGPITRLIRAVPDDALRQLSAAVVDNYGRVEPDIPAELRPQLPTLYRSRFSGAPSVKGLSACAARTFFRFRYRTSRETSSRTNLAMYWGWCTTAIQLL